MKLYSSLIWSFNNHLSLNVRSNLAINKLNFVIINKVKYIILTLEKITQDMYVYLLANWYPREILDAKGKGGSITTGHICKKCDRS